MINFKFYHYAIVLGIMALSQTNAAQREIYFTDFEDAQAGVEAAKRAGMFAVGVGFDLLRACDKQINSFKNFDLDDFINEVQMVKK